MNDALSDLVFKRVARYRKVYGISSCPGRGSVQPIFIVVSDIPEIFNVLADRSGANRDRCVRTSCVMINVVSEGKRRVARRFSYCIMPLFNVVPDNHGCLTSPPTVTRCIMQMRALPLPFPLLARLSRYAACATRCDHWRNVNP